MNDESNEEAVSSGGPDSPQESPRPVARVPLADEVLSDALRPLRESLRQVAQFYSVTPAMQAIQELAARQAAMVHDIVRPMDLAVIQAVHEQAAKSAEIVQSVYGPQLEVFNAMAWTHVGESVKALQANITSSLVPLTAFRLPEIPVLDFGTARIAADMSAALRAMGSAPYSSSALPRTFEQAAEALEEVGASSATEGPDEEISTALLQHGEAAGSLLSSDVELQDLAARVEAAVTPAGRISRRTKRVLMGSLIFAAWWEAYVLLPEAVHTLLDIVAMISLARSLAAGFYGDEE